jgi:peroxiredoxin
MIELDQLERRHEDFDRRNFQVVAVSVDALEPSQKTQHDFPHLTILSDEGHGLSDVVDLLHRGEGPDGSDIDAPTTIIIDRHGVVRWLYRSPEVIVRLSPDEVLRAVDQNP